MTIDLTFTNNKYVNKAFEFVVLPQQLNENTHTHTHALQSKLQRNCIYINFLLFIYWNRFCCFCFYRNCTSFAANSSFIHSHINQAIFCLCGDRETFIVSFHFVRSFIVFIDPELCHRTMFHLRELYGEFYLRQ